MTSLHGQHVLVVGGSSGIGLATAKAAVEAGAHVTIAGRSEAKLELAVQALGHGAVGKPVDAMDDASVEHFFADGKIWNHVVATTGAGGRGEISRIAMADALTAMNAKFWTYFRVARAAKIASGGSLTLVSGSLGSKPTSGAALVSAINAAIEGLTRGLALDFAPTRVNTVSPGIIDTPLWDRMRVADKNAMYAMAAATLPVRRIGQPQDVGQAILFLMTNPFATGSVLHLDGGAMLL
jgi:NAD(P)-dependent dehydrogenase (short-subunit alcohol dehydrogenase family)